MCVVVLSALPLFEDPGPHKLTSALLLSEVTNQTGKTDIKEYDHLKQKLRMNPVQVSNHVRYAKH